MLPILTTKKNLIKLQLEALLDMNMLNMVLYFEIQVLAHLA